MRRCPVTGWKGIYCKKRNLIAVFDLRVKIYDAADFQLLFETRQIKDPSGFCLHPAGEELWIFTTSSVLHRVDLKTLQSEKIAELRKLSRSLMKCHFEIEGMVFISREKLLIYGFGIGSQILLLYDTKNATLRKLYHDESSVDTFYQAFPGQLCIVARWIGLQEGFPLLQRKTLDCRLEETENYLIQEITVNTLKKDVLQEVAYYAQESGYILCETGSAFPEGYVAVNTEKKELLHGVILPDFGHEPEFIPTSQKNTLIAFDGMKVSIVQIGDGQLRQRSIAEGEIEDCLFIGEDLLLLGEEKSRLMKEKEWSLEGTAYAKC